MRTIIVLSIFTLFSSLFVFGGGRTAVVTVENPGDFERKNETIEIRLNELTQKLGAIDADRLLVADRNGGSALLSQLTESELLFQSNFQPLEKREFIVNVVEKKLARRQSLVEGRFETPREDYAWENDRIAFRMYGPALAAEVNNGIDVWRKRVRYLIVDKWYNES